MNDINIPNAYANQMLAVLREIQSEALKDTDDPHTVLARLSQMAAGASALVCNLKPAKKAKRLSRADRWSAAASRATDGLQELVDLQDEYQSWLDNLPEGLQSSAVADKLQAVVDLDLQGAKDTADEAEGADLPLGWGKD